MDFKDDSISSPLRPPVNALKPEPTTKRVNRLTSLLERLSHAGTPVKLNIDQRDFIATAAPKEFADASYNLLVAGLPVAHLAKLYTRNINILPDQVARLKALLPPGHLLQMIFCEHEMLLYFLSDLEDVSRTISQMTILSNASVEFRRLAHISSHLTMAELHNEREDEVIFPELVRGGYTNLATAFRAEHCYISGAAHNLDDLIETFGLTDLLEFRRRLEKATKYIVPAMREHIFKEEHILYPIAVDVIKERVWERIKDLCNEIGYCCFESEW